MRLRLSIHGLIVSLLLLSGCDFSSREAVFTIGDHGPPTPLLMQYSEDFAVSRSVRSGARTWRTEIDRERPDRKVHIVSEGICPDRVRIITSGAQNSESVYINGYRYSLQPNKKWRKSQTKPPQVDNFACGPKIPPPDSTAVRILAEQFGNLELDPPTIREIAGRKCRDWMIKTEGALQFENCYDVTTHELVQTRRSEETLTYYLNIPLEIEAPSVAP
jgi:hypothetical protein